jgi:DNA mismatch endonuclease (patch repair protein)
MVPKVNTSYWLPKLERNRKRDLRNERKLRRLGWSVFSIWECRLKKSSFAQLQSLLLTILSAK